MIYYFWKTKGIRPSVIYNMPRGELILLMAFYEKEMQEIEEMMKREIEE
ncbi:hypothetical protein [Anaerophilus nitritogenes]|nr:hypothetical protein [Anaerophilus nitritogenes]